MPSDQVTDPEEKRLEKLHWDKFGAYGDEEGAFRSALAWLPLDENTQSVEAAIMDVADDITYALHDLEDFYGSRPLDLHAARDALSLWRGTFANTELLPATHLVENPFEALRAKLARDYPGRFQRDEYDEAALAVDGHLIMLQQESVGSRRAKANTGRFVSQVITDFLKDLLLKDTPGPDGPPVQLSPAHWHIVQLLKEITRSFVIQRPDFVVIQRGQQVLLRELLDHLCTWCEKLNAVCLGHSARATDFTGPAPSSISCPD